MSKEDYKCLIDYYQQYIKFNFYNSNFKNIKYKNTITILYFRYFNNIEI